MKQRYRTGDQALVREINLSIVFNQLWTNSPLSRAQLAKLTGLNKTTISSLVHELLTKELVRETGLQVSQGGRPAHLIELNPQAGGMIGVEIGVDFICAILTNFRADIEWRHREALDSHWTYRSIIQRVIEIIEDATRMADRLRVPLLGVGVGVPGLVDLDSGAVLFAPNLQWRNVPLGDILAETLTIPFTIDNEANLSAMGEYYFGAARSIETFVYISIGVGLGGSVFLDGQPYRGLGGYAGEFGHMALQEGGLPCKCGSNGCWETLVSIPAVVNRARAAAKLSPNSRILELAGGQLDKVSLSVVTQAAKEKDVTALEILTQTGHYLGMGIANLVNAFNPELVVLGGALSEAYLFMLPAVEKMMLKGVIAEPAKSTPIVISSYGSHACPLGAVGSVLHKILTTPNYTWATSPAGGRT